MHVVEQTYLGNCVILIINFDNIIIPVIKVNRILYVQKRVKNQFESEFDRMDTGQGCTILGVTKFNS